VLLAKLLKGSLLSMVLNETSKRTERSCIARRANSAAKIVSKRLGSPHRAGRSAHWVKVKNPKAPAVNREAEEDWGRNGR
jgi:hypothetical protein